MEDYEKRTPVLQVYAKGMNRMWTLVKRTVKLVYRTDNFKVTSISHVSIMPLSCMMWTGSCAYG